MQPILFRIPITADGIPVYGFGMMLFITFIATTWLACRRAEKAGIAREVLQDVAVWVFLAGIIGARVTYLIFHEKIHDPLQLLIQLPRIWDGGIILYGAIAGALLGYLIGHWLIFRHKENVTFLRIADVIAPTVALGLIFGRMGCLLNGCCYGQVACETCCPGVTFPLSAPAEGQLVHAGSQTACGFLVDYRGRAQVTHVEPGSAAEASGLKPGDIIVKMNDREISGAEGIWSVLNDRNIPRDQKADVTLTVEREGKTVEIPTFRPRTLRLLPTQLFESISMILLLFLLLAFEPFKRYDGQVIGLLMVCYGIHRYVNEILRSDERPVGFESNVSILVIAGGVALLGWLWWSGRNQAAEKSTQTARPSVKAAAGSA